MGREQVVEQRRQNHSVGPHREPGRQVKIEPDAPPGTPRRGASVVSGLSGRLWARPERGAQFDRPYR